MRVRFLMLGGFLGAGKTTLIARLARHYVDAGRKVGLVTNDQAYNLVDTQALRAQGFDVGEVPGACFCCKFDDLVSTVSLLADAHRPEVIICEPVGSCTDLVATVVEPLKHLYGDRYEIAPFVVLLKPEHGTKILLGGTGHGFSPKAEYIFLKQIEEADVVALNKIDKLTEAERDELLAAVRERFPDKEVLALSARTAEGFDALAESLDRPEPVHLALDIDYDVYAEGEAELGWLNATARLKANPGQPPLTVDDLVVRLVKRLQAALEAADAEPAHLKVLAAAGGQTAIANLVGSDVDVELSQASGAEGSDVELTVNARVATSPEELSELVVAQIAALAGELSVSHEVANLQCFRPGRPVPTHRMAPG